MGSNEVKKTISLLRESGCRNMILTGGEPTLRDDLPEIIDHCKKIGFLKIHIQTNGRRFLDPEFAKVVASCDIVDIFLSIHGHTADIHEAVTGVKGSFDETMKGIDNLVTLNCPPRTNTVICGPNHRSLDKTAKALIAKGVKEIQFSFVHPKGEALRNPEMVPDITEAMPSLAKALDLNDDRVKVLSEAVPFCLLGEHHVHAAERRLPESYREDDFSKRRGEACTDCSFLKLCPGIWESYQREIELHPSGCKERPY